MSVIDTTTEVPVLATPSRPEGRMGLRQFLRVVRENILATYAPEDFDKDFIARRLLWRRTFVVNEPSGVRHVLLDNAQNYKKSELSRRILEPGLGRGLITTDGELWRRHRRIMAPAFDPRTVAGYAPVMTEVTKELLTQWDALPEHSVVDAAVAMMHTTRHIISRAMFSSDSDGIVDVVERGVSEYQTTVRPSLLALLHVPEWSYLRKRFQRFTESNKANGTHWRRRVFRRSVKRRARKMKVLLTSPFAPVPSQDRLSAC